MNHFVYPDHPVTCNPLLPLPRCWVLHALQHQDWEACRVGSAGVPHPLPQEEAPVSAVLLQDDRELQGQAGDLGQEG